jgi:hypothetical protein
LGTYVSDDELGGTALTEPPPYPDLPVGVTFLREGGRYACSFDIAWTVPDVGSGIYRVPVLQVTENRQGMAGWGRSTSA